MLSNENNSLHEFCARCLCVQFNSLSACTLHIDKEETHTPQSLAERNVEFSSLAKEHNIAEYDGWEVGEVGVYDDEDDELSDDVIE